MQSFVCRATESEKRHTWRVWLPVPCATCSQRGSINAGQQKIPKRNGQSLCCRNFRRNKGKPSTFIRLFRERFLCQCLAFSLILLPIIDVYAQFLNTTLMADAGVSDHFLRNAETMYEKETDQWHFSQMEVRNMCTQCYCFLNGLSTKKLSRLIERYKKDKTRSYSRQTLGGVHRLRVLVQRTYRDNGRTCARFRQCLPPSGNQSRLLTAVHT